MREWCEWFRQNVECSCYLFKIKKKTTAWPNSKPCHVLPLSIEANRMVWVWSACLCVCVFGFRCCTLLRQKLQVDRSGIIGSSIEMQKSTAKMPTKMLALMRLWWHSLWINSKHLIRYSISLTGCACVCVSVCALNFNLLPLHSNRHGKFNSNGIHPWRFNSHHLFKQHSFAQSHYDVRINYCMWNHK